MKNGIEVRQLNLSYGGPIIVKDMDLILPREKISVIIGANGCGKSTLLKSMARILKPDMGEIYVDRQNVHTAASRDIAKIVAVLPQNPVAPSGLTVEELVSYGRFPHKKGFGALGQKDFSIIEESLALSGMTELRTTPLSELSGGQRQRAWIAMTLCQKTPYLLLDEPTTFLDLSHQLDILQLLARLNKEEGRTIVMVLHELNNASRFADHMVGMKSGRVVAQGTPAEVVTKENLREIFDINADITINPETNKPYFTTYESA